MTSESRSVVSDSLRPHGLYSPWNSPGQNTWMGSLSLLQEIIPIQGSNRSPALWVDSLPAEPQGKPKNTGVGSLSLLQRIFPTQELNWGLLHCNWALPTELLYQLSYQGRLDMTKTLSNCQLMIGWSLRNIECFITWLKPLLIIKLSMFLEDHPIINWLVCGRIN